MRPPRSTPRTPPIRVTAPTAPISVTIWAISVVSFVIIQLPPGDFVDAYIANLSASGSVVSQQEAQAMRALLGMRRLVQQIAAEFANVGEDGAVVLGHVFPEVGGGESTPQH